jgi:hypothetical protein
MKRYVVKVSTKYTGTKTRLGKWIKPKKRVVYLPNHLTPRMSLFNLAVYQELRKKKSLRRKDFAWW